MEEQSIAPSKLPKIAGIVTLIIGALLLANALYAGGATTFVLAAIPIAGGIQMLMRRAWGAFGLALFQAGQLVLAAAAIVRAGEVPLDLLFALGLSVGFALVTGAVLFWVGRKTLQSGGMRGWAWPWLLVAGLMSIPFVLMRPFTIPTGSMEDTLLIGDKILMAPGEFVPPRDELIVLAYPVDKRQTFLKRVIGVGGDRIKIVNKQVLRNGKPLKEPYALLKREYPDEFADNFPSEPNAPLDTRGTNMLKNNVVDGEVIVPPGKYFVMGDNRDHSLDSRYWGFVDRKDVLGKPVLIYDSVDVPTDRLGGGTHAGRTRWERIFTWVR